jgi:osmotically-inducible protein OsmY
LRTLTLAMILMMSLSGCTWFTHKVRDKPIQPDPLDTSLGEDIDDFQIEVAVGVNIKKAHPLLDRSHVNVHSYNGVVLLTGEVPSEEMRNLAGDTARSFRGVRQVHNELQTMGVTSFLSRTNDGWLSTKVRSKLLADENIDSGKIKVVTENSVVYLMGIVTPALADRAAGVARTTTGIRKVVKVFEYLEN